ncbi:Gfo/Idh/MocA family protein [Alienimonas chondri]|uniref:Inositol 2-dehydrogenase/D-chiro-inositol 3-dehydrogenase n=1 Tax=Alienimonas chondri TaxID=2681879 RepID=A0ABX1V7J4_9PLAN|nr:Gfo/Idh/MocA family oxidoreductase [Alienimonas chondri]NNJ24193.1 Inositol 2-dehydrogenase/D-chiro-inositol 3-dehydrogenase [Alienimonas chondri]
MIRIGIVGLGFMGYTHFTASAKLRGGKITAIASRNAKKRAGDWTGLKGNFGPPAGKVDLSKVTAHETVDELLADPNVDMVDVCLPTKMHEEVTLKAAAAGKHVFVEKPIAPDLASADRMVKACEKAGVLLMVGHVLPFFPEFRYLHEATEKKKYGKLRAAHFARVICPPDWREGEDDFVELGGWGADLHVHDTHFISLLCGVPTKVFSRGLLREGLIEHVQSEYVWDDAKGANPPVGSVAGGIAAKGHDFRHGFEAHFEKATILFNAANLGGEFSVDRPLTVVSQGGQVREPSLKGGEEWFSPFAAELQAAVKGVKEHAAPRVLSGALARDALKVVSAETKSVKAGGKLVTV